MFMPQPTISTSCPTEHELTFLPEQEQADPDFFFQDFGDNRIAQFLATHKAPHRHKYHEIAWFRHGKSRHLLDGELEEVPSHTIVLVSKGRVHSYQHLKKPEGNVIRFNDDFLTATSSIL